MPAGQRHEIEPTGARTAGEVAQQRPQRVALLCYSIGLGEWFKRSFEGARRRHTPAFIGRFEELGRAWGADITAGRDDSDFWEKQLPARMAELAAGLPDGQKFDAIIVDYGFFGIIPLLLGDRAARPVRTGAAAARAGTGVRRSPTARPP